MIPNSLAVLQPNPFPTIAWMARYLYAETVCLTSVDRWSRKGFAHRFKIRDDKQAFWITFPVLTEDRSKPINEVRLAVTKEWKSKLFRTLETCYKNSIYYDLYRAEIEEDFENAFEKSLLIEANTYLNERLWTYLGLDHRKIVEMNTVEEVYERLIENEYSLIWQMDEIQNIQRVLPLSEDFPVELPAYRQHFPSFLPNCSGLDLLFEVGSYSFHIFDSIQNQLMLWHDEKKSH